MQLYKMCWFLHKFNLLEIFQSIISFYSLAFIFCFPDKSRSRTSNDSKKEMTIPKEPNIAAQTFTFRELAAATKNFRPECLLGEGGFGRVYKGRLESTGQVCYLQHTHR